MPKSNNTAKVYSLAEYFDFENISEGKHEFWDGKIHAMAYTSPTHGELQTNFSDALAACLKSKGCLRYTSDRMVLVPDCNKVFYPDIVIVCGEQQFYQHKKNMKATLNPSVIIEILSESTEQEDRIDKWTCYQSIASLEHYIMVQQTTMGVHSYRRKGERVWDYVSAYKPDDTIEVMECIVKVADIYAGIE